MACAKTSDKVTVTVTPAGQSTGAMDISGWTEVQIVRGIEICPSTFDVSFTARSPTSDVASVVNPGDAIVVKIGADAVVTGYVDKVLDTASARTHTLRLVGRGKCQDLVDCSAEWPAPGGQITGASALEIAQKLAAPYGITVSQPASVPPPPGGVIPQFNLTLTETAWQILEEVCRYQQLLAYEGTDGNLILSQVSTARAASGFVDGSNIQQSTLTRAADERFSEYDAFLVNMDVMADTGSGGNLIGQATDPNVKRHRRRAIIAEAPAGRQNIAQARAIWECARRAGRSTVVTLTTDTWRDSAGTLWTPNTIAPVNLPKRNFQQDLAISQVIYKRGGGGTTCDLELMPSYAFIPEPILLLAPVGGVNA